MTRRWLAAAGGLILLTGLWLFLKPTALQLLPTTDVSLSYHLSVDKGVVTGPAVLPARQGYPVKITFLSDRADRVHLHGYEIWQTVAAGEMSELVFDAKHSGRYLLELEEQSIPLASLEVYP